MKYFLIFLFSLTLAFAEPLVFPLHSKTSFHIHEKQDITHLVFGLATTVAQAESDLDFDLVILKKEPYLVEITPRKVHMLSKDNTEWAEERRLILEELIDHPFLFRVKSEYEVEELTGQLASFEKRILEKSQYIIGATKWTYTPFLTELFQLAGNDLQVDQNYLVSAFPLLGLEDEKFDDKGFTIVESSQVTIDKIEGDKIYGSWGGTATITYNTEQSPETAFHKWSVAVVSETSWNRENALLQKGWSHKTFGMAYKPMDSISLLYYYNNIYTNIHQTWESYPSK